MYTGLSTIFIHTCLLVHNQHICACICSCLTVMTLSRYLTYLSAVKHHGSVIACCGAL